MNPQARRLVPVIAAVVVFAVLPFVIPSFLTFQFAFAGAYACAILGLTVLTGTNGQISLGQGAFMAAGGYTLAILAHSAGWPPELAIPIAAVVAFVLGGVVGLIALRLTGAYLALATFALAVSVSPLIKRFGWITGGAQGVTLPFSRDSRVLYAETWGIAALLLLITWFMLRGRIGRSLRAIRDNEIAAASFGIDPVPYKTFAFALSAAYAGIAGALVATATAYVSPDTFGLQLSLTLIIGVVIGGLDSLWGAVIGGLVVEFLPLAAQSINVAATSLVYGIALILVMILMPGGIAGALRTLSRR
jgi:branched-chain amino acid transport system permease protein